MADIPWPDWTAKPWPNMTEKALQGQINYELRRAGWLVYHTHRSDRSESGYPDISAVAADRRRHLFAEVKRRGQWPTAKQTVWLDALTSAGCEVWVVNPDNVGDFYASAVYGQPVPPERRRPDLHRPEEATRARRPHPRQPRR